MTHAARLGSFAALVLVTVTAACGGDDRTTVMVDGGMDGDSLTDGAQQPTDGPPADGSMNPLPPEVSPTCLDGQYTESLPNATASLASLISAYSPAAYKTFVHDALGVRYPTGQYIVDNALSMSAQDCVDLFLSASDRTTAKGVLNAMSTVVHECGHFLDNALDVPGGRTYVITPALTLTALGASYAGTNSVFARSLIRGDAHYAKRPACPTMGPSGCDNYAGVYLDGNPNDAVFQSGDQGFDLLLDEAVQYVNSLATARSFADQLPTGTSISERDGILTMLWYVERYLALARASHPTDYAYLTGSAQWRTAILTTWGRAWLYLQATTGQQNLGINDDKIIALVREPALLDEIQRIRTAHGCP